MTCLKATCKINVMMDMKCIESRKPYLKCFYLSDQKVAKNLKFDENLTWRYFANTLLSKSIQIVVEYCSKFPSEAFEIKITILKFLSCRSYFGTFKQLKIFIFTPF